MRRQQRQTRRARNTYYLNDLDCAQLPLDAKPATVHTVGARVLLQGTASIDAITNEELEEQDSYKWEQYGWPTRHVTMAPDNGEEFATLLRRGEAKAICDGSYKQGYSSSAFLTMNKNTIQGNNIVPGRKQDQSSYRGELGGIYGLVVMTKAVCKKHAVTDGAITIGYDNEGSIKALNNGRTPNCNWNSYDILCAIKHEIAESPIQWTFKWIEGHQDDHVATDELDADSYKHLTLPTNLRVEIAGGRAALQTKPSYTTEY